MRFAPATASQVKASPGLARGEFFVRYAAAYACTLIAIAAAQLVIPSSWALVMAIITLIGLPLSLALRKTNLCVGKYRIPRFLINSTVVILSGFAGLYVLIASQPELLTRGLYFTVMITHSAGDSITLLMNLFLVFAVFRSLAILNDKDAVLSAVPSFSVLLLLIVVHRGPQIVGYFLLWAVAAAILFSLDHRADLRRHLGGVVPAMEPGQDMKLAARGLASVLGFSLITAIGISYYLSSRNPEERGQLESWILSMAGRMTQLALNLPDVSVNSGPERRIDFASGPALPTRAELWSVAAANEQLQPIYPEYWRMFTLSDYNGAAWAQTPGAGTAIPLEYIAPSRMPWLRPNVQSNSQPQITFQTTPRRSEQRSNGSSPRQQGNRNAQSNREADRSGQRYARRRRGYDVLARYPAAAQMMKNYGGQRKLIVQLVAPRVVNSGFVPLLPATRLLRIRAQEPPFTVRLRQDGAMDVGVLEPNETCVVFSEVAPNKAYGNQPSSHAGPPQLKSQRPNPQASLSRQERRANLQLPETLMQPTSRLRQFVRTVLRSSPARESDYARARRLALAVQNSATYTLQPPQIPSGRDAAEYFLFESKRGYCTYFAGALTVACRVAGIPARVVSGFVNPDWGTPPGQTGILREANAHAWTEVWVEGWGWAPLDATPADNRGQNAPDWWESWRDRFVNLVLAAKYKIAQHRLAAVVLLILALGGVLWFVVRRGLADPILARYAAYSQGRLTFRNDQTRRMITKSYARAMKKVAKKFRRCARWETPREYLAAAEAALVLENPVPLREITQLYERAQYAPQALQATDGTHAYELVRQLSWRRQRS